MGDIDWARQKLTFRRSVWEVRSETGVKDTKTHRLRTIALDAAASGCSPLDASVPTLMPGWLGWPSVMAPTCGRQAWTDWRHERQTASPSVRTPMRHPGAGDGPAWPFRFHDLRHLSATELIGGG